MIYDASGDRRAGAPALALRVLPPADLQPRAQRARDRPRRRPRGGRRRRAPGSRSGRSRASPARSPRRSAAGAPPRNSCAWRRGGEGAIESTLRFLLSPKSAYVDGQVIEISAVDSSDVVVPGDWEQPLAGRVAAVTGAARGIGESIAETLARDGAEVICIDVPQAGGDLTEVANRIGGSALQLDITDDAAPGRLADHVAERHGRLDILVHNAGITRDKTLGRMEPEQWDVGARGQPAQPAAPERGAARARPDRRGRPDRHASPRSAGSPATAARRTTRRRRRASSGWSTALAPELAKRRRDDQRRRARASSRRDDRRDAARRRARPDGAPTACSRVASRWTSPRRSPGWRARPRPG